MLKINTLSVNEDDVTYNDLLKYINIPPHPKFKNLSNYGEIFVKHLLKRVHTT